MAVQQEVAAAGSAWLGKWAGKEKCPVCLETPWRPLLHRTVIRVLCRAREVNLFPCPPYAIDAREVWTPVF